MLLSAVIERNDIKINVFPETKNPEMINNNTIIIYMKSFKKSNTY